MATHSSTLAWKIPWTEEPSRLQSIIFKVKNIRKIHTDSKHLRVRKKRCSELWWKSLRLKPLRRRELETSGGSSLSEDQTKTV